MLCRSLLDVFDIIDVIAVYVREFLGGVGEALGFCGLTFGADARQGHVVNFHDGDSFFLGLDNGHRIGDGFTVLVKRFSLYQFFAVGEAGFYCFTRFGGVFRFDCNGVQQAVFVDILDFIHFHNLTLSDAVLRLSNL